MVSPWWAVSAHDVLLSVSVMLIMLTVVVILSIVAYKATFRSDYMILPLNQLVSFFHFLSEKTVSICRNPWLLDHSTVFVQVIVCI